MKKLLLLTLAFAGQCLNAQNVAARCENAYSLCNSVGVPFANTYNGGAVSTGMGVACLILLPNPTWFTLPVNQNGTLSYSIAQIDPSGNAIGTNYAIWGPFDGNGTYCDDQLNPSTLVTCDNSTNPFPPAFSLPNATAGTSYVVMVLNPSNRSCDITFTAENEISTTALNHNNCAQLSAKNFAENNFSLYPNPAKGSVNLLPQGNNLIATVKISDLTGKTIYTLKNTAKGALTINTTGFASGTYFIEITGSNSITTIKKLLVE